MFDGFEWTIEWFKTPVIPFGQSMTVLCISQKKDKCQ